jgi:hypothetical protein
MSLEHFEESINLFPNSIHQHFMYFQERGVSTHDHLQIQVDKVLYASILGIRHFLS